MVGVGGNDIAKLISDRLRYKIQIYYRVDTPETQFTLSEEEVNQLVNEIQSYDADKIMLIAFGSKLTAIPYREK